MTTGQLIGGRYRLGPTIGEGGMGVVHRAHDETLDTSVAVKIVRSEQAPYLIRWFLRGARLAQKIDHPHVVQTTDHGRLEDGGAFLVMELIEGVDFDTIITSDLPLRQKLNLLNQALEALAYVHARGILHRDIKPDNLLLVRSETGKVLVKIADFGLAALYDQTGPNEDGFDASDRLWVTGTPHYMPPERVDDDLPLGPSSDLYSVGVIAYRLLSGDLPFPQPGLPGLYLKRTQEAPALSPSEGLDVPDSLLDVTHRLIRLNMEERYQVAADVIRDLAPHQSPFVLRPDEWIALAPHVLDKKFAQEETIASLSSDLTDDIALTSELLSNPALWNREVVRSQLEALAQQTEEGESKMAVLLGIPGAGGAEMLRTFSTACAQAGRFTVLSGTFESVAGRRPGLRQILEDYLMSTRLDAFRMRRLLWIQRKQLGLADDDDLDNLFHFLRPRAGADDNAENHQNEVFAVFVRTLRALAIERPVMLTLEGLGQGGELSGAFLEFLAFELSFEPFPLMFLGSSGLLNVHEDFSVRFARTNRHEGILRHSIDLAPLDAPVLSNHLVRCFGLTHDAARRLAIETGGLPVLAGALAELFEPSQKIESEDSPLTTSTLDPAYRLSTPLAERVMDTVNRRLDGRADGEILHWVLCCVAVLGDEVGLDMLERLVSERLEPDEFDDHIDSLVRLNLLADRGDLGQRTVRLEPSVLRRALLNHEDNGHRSLHRRAAEVRSKGDSGDLPREFGAIGDHLAAAGDLAGAVEYWLQAVDFEAELGDALLAAAFGLKTLDAMEVGDPRRNSLAIRMGRTLLDAGSAGRAKTVLGEVLLTGDADESLLAGEVLADVYENHGESLAWKDLIEDLGQHEDSASPAGLRAFLRTRSMWLNSYGRGQEARRDAQAALDGATDGSETQRAAQRLMYCCLSTGDLDEAEVAARKALEHSAGHSDLQVRSLRALGVALTWKGRPSAAAETQQEALRLCRRRGLTARTPIALHDLADAWRLCGRLRKAEEAYAQAISSGSELALSHTVELSRVKQIMCRLGRGHTGGVIEELRALAPSAAAAGLGLAVPFCSLLEAWSCAITSDVPGVMEALDRVGNLEAVAVDPGIPSILTVVAGALNGVPDAQTYEASLLELAGQLESNLRAVDGPS